MVDAVVRYVAEHPGCTSDDLRAAGYDVTAAWLMCAGFGPLCVGRGEHDANVWSLSYTGKRLIEGEGEAG